MSLFNIVSSTFFVRMLLRRQSHRLWRGKDLCIWLPKLKEFRSLAIYDTKTKVETINQRCRLKMIGGWNFMAALILGALSCINIVAGSPAQSAGISEIEVIGNKFFDSVSGKQFFMKGIAYQPSRSLEELESAKGTYDTKYIDPLADPEICLRDIPYLKELNVNTIRVYSIDPTKPHDECMEAFAAAGIYLLLDLSEPDLSIPRDKPTWDVNIWNRYKDVVDAMQKYPNVLGFFAGNEVTNDKTNTDASPFVKAAIRDVKNYIKSKKYRRIPVGYSSNDDAETREHLAQYFACGEICADFYGINMYEWCGYSSFGTSGYKERTEEFEDYPLPIFFSEFGCNLVRPRPFTEVAALFGSKMSKTWSGGLAYMYYEEENSYGVVKVDEAGQVEKLDDFDFLKTQFSKAKPEGISKSDYLKSLPERKKIDCPRESSSKNWEANNLTPPTPNVDKCDCLNKLLPCQILPFADPSKYKKLFDTVCRKVNCSDIVADGKKGVYGRFSDCTTEQKLALQISKLYAQNKDKADTCPISSKNVYFNKDYEKLLNDGKCNVAGLEFLKAQSNKTSKDVPKETEDQKGTTAVPNATKVGAGSLTQYKNSGCAILFVTIFIASFLL